eukprot:5581081-Prymnesium_polylepis.1
MARPHPNTAGGGRRDGLGGRAAAARLSDPIAQSGLALRRLMGAEVLPIPRLALRGLMRGSVPGPALRRSMLGVLRGSHTWACAEAATRHPGAGKGAGVGAGVGA